MALPFSNTPPKTLMREKGEEALRISYSLERSDFARINSVEEAVEQMRGEDPFLFLLVCTTEQDSFFKKGVELEPTVLDQ